MSARSLGKPAALAATVATATAVTLYAHKVNSRRLSQCTSRGQWLEDKWRVLQSLGDVSDIGSFSLAYLVSSTQQYLELLDVNKDGKIDVYDLQLLLDFNRDGAVNGEGLKALGQQLIEVIKAKSAEFKQGRFRALSAQEAKEAAALDLRPFFSHGVGPVAATAELTDTVAAQIPRPLVDGQVELDLSSSLRYVNWLMYSSESPVFMAWQDKLGNTNVSALKWARCVRSKQDPAVKRKMIERNQGTAERCLYFTSPKTKLAPSANGSEVQRIRFGSIDSGLVVASHLTYAGEGVPFSDTFRLQSQIVLTKERPLHNRPGKDGKRASAQDSAPAEDNTHLRISYEILWLKPPPLPVRAVLARVLKGKMAESWTEFGTFLKEFV